MIGKYSDSRQDLSSDNDSDDEKDTSERFTNDSESDYSSNRLDDGASFSDSESVQSPSQTTSFGSKDFDVYQNKVIYKSFQLVNGHTLMKRRGASKHVSSH